VAQPSPHGGEAEIPTSDWRISNRLGLAGRETIRPFRSRPSGNRGRRRGRHENRRRSIMLTNRRRTKTETRLNRLFPMAGRRRYEDRAVYVIATAIRSYFRETITIYKGRSKSPVEISQRPTTNVWYIYMYGPSGRKCFEFENDSSAGAEYEFRQFVPHKPTAPREYFDVRTTRPRLTVCSFNAPKSLRRRTCSSVRNSSSPYTGGRLHTHSFTTRNPHLFRLFTPYHARFHYSVILAYFLPRSSLHTTRVFNSYSIHCPSPLPPLFPIK